MKAKAAANATDATAAATADAAAGRPLNTSFSIFADVQALYARTYQAAKGAPAAPAAPDKKSAGPSTPMIVGGVAAVGLVLVLLNKKKSS